MSYVEWALLIYALGVPVAAGAFEAIDSDNGKGLVPALLWPAIPLFLLGHIVTKKLSPKDTP